jgi:hypothetical protein
MERNVTTKVLFLIGIIVFYSLPLFGIQQPKSGILFFPKRMGRSGEAEIAR